MRPLSELEAIFEPLPAEDARARAEELLRASEEVLEHWVRAHGNEPADGEREGFRLLALHRQGTKGDPSFNACRETCREIAYHYNLVTMHDTHSDITDRLYIMAMVCKHLFLFISGKMQVAELGDFCCSSRPVRASDAAPTA